MMNNALIGDPFTDVKITILGVPNNTSDNNGTNFLLKIL